MKSPPELWAEVSDAPALARHLGEFDDIKITRLVPETTVAWEGGSACGTVKLEPAGWGTRVVLTAEVPPSEPQPVPGPPAPGPPDPEPPAPDPEPLPPAAKGVFARIRRWFVPEVPPPEPVAEPELAPEPEPSQPDDPTQAILNAALDSLGQAHHRPYSRA